MADDIREYFEDGSFNVLGVYGSELTTDMKREIQWAFDNGIPVTCLDDAIGAEYQGLMRVVDSFVQE